ncbi:MAG: anti-sigma-factor antagonist [Acidimicrobiales bacterium]|nr:anti-sigma-factor antagonist [Acidimicrobiales bacterium]
MRPLLRIDRAEGPGETVLVLGGEIDLSSAHLLAEAIDAAIDAGARRVVVDFSAVTFVNSTGLGVMVGATKRLRAMGGDLVARAFRGMPAAALAITGLEEFLTIER